MIDATMLAIMPCSKDPLIFGEDFEDPGKSFNFKFLKGFNILRFIICFVLHRLCTYYSKSSCILPHAIQAISHCYSSFYWWNMSRCC